MKSSALHACITEGNGQGLRKPLLPGPLLRAALYHEQKQRGRDKLSFHIAKPLEIRYGSCKAVSLKGSGSR